MKKTLLLLLLAPLLSIGQTNTFPASGNVGIGTISPQTKLNINIGTGEAEYPTTTSKGNVLEILKASNNDLEIGNSRALNGRRAWILARHSSTTGYGQYYSTLHLQPGIGDKSQYRGVAIGYLASTVVPTGTHLAVNGNVGIGTSNPGSWKLAVNGNIRAKEIKVETSWSDFVFEGDYDLPALEEVERHIKEKGHLKDIPSAKEVEENGILLGEMDSKLLLKIEELTLYIIELNKKIEKQREEIEQLKKP